MTALPAAVDFTDASTTEAEFKTAITDQRAFLAGLLGTDGTLATAQSTLKTLCSAVNAKTTTYSLIAADRGKVIYCTGSGGWTLTLPVTTTTDFGVGWACAVRNSTTGTITIARSSTNTIDGATSVTLAAGESCILFIAATAAWVRIGYTAGKTDAQIASASRIRQVVTATISAATGATVIPDDATVPLNTEGTQIVTGSITPAATANTVRVRASFSVVVPSHSSVANNVLIAAVFRGATCIGAARQESVTGVDVNSLSGVISLDLLDSPSTTSATAYTIRIGLSTSIYGATWYVNRTIASATALGSMMANSIISLEEVVA